MKPQLPGSYPLQFACVLGGIAAVGFGAVYWLDVDARNTGYRGTGMVDLSTAEIEAAEARLNTGWAEAVYTEEPYIPEPDSVKASEVYENVGVLGDLTDDNFNRLMTAMTEWVAPEEGCAYCHGDEGNFASDDLYTKIVSRRMLQMTRNINDNWPEHAYPAGVTCYTCHRGQPVPENIWFNETQPRVGMSFGADVGQNLPNAGANYSSLPIAAFETYLANYDNDVSLQDQVSRTDKFDRTIKAAEGTYSLMMHYSEALGENCTYCHNTRSFQSWDQSTPVRVRALAGQQMVREINEEYLDPLQSSYPPNRLGPTGDAPKANCLTCHNGQSKPMGGYSVIDHWPELASEAEPDYTAAAAQIGAEAMGSAEGVAAEGEEPADEEAGAEGEEAPAENN